MEFLFSLQFLLEMTPTFLIAENNAFPEVFNRLFNSYQLAPGFPEQYFFYPQLTVATDGRLLMLINPIARSRWDLNLDFEEATRRNFFD